MHKCCNCKAVSKWLAAIILKCTTAVFVPFLPLLRFTLSLLQEEGVALITGWPTMAGAWQTSSLEPLQTARKDRGKGKFSGNKSECSQSAALWQLSCLQLQKTQTYFIFYYSSNFSEFLKHAIPGYLVSGTDLFPLRLSNKKMTTVNTTIAVWCKGIKIIPIFCQMGKCVFWQVAEF